MARYRLSRSAELSSTGELRCAKRLRTMIAWSPNWISSSAYTGRACSLSGLRAKQCGRKNESGAGSHARTEALNDVLKQRPIAGVAPQPEARIISANLLIFSARTLIGVSRETTAVVESVVRPICR